MEHRRDWKNKLVRARFLFAVKNDDDSVREAQKGDRVPTGAEKTSFLMVFCARLRPRHLMDDALG